MRTLLGGLSSEYRYQASLRVAEHLFQTRQWATADNILVYMSLPFELDTVAICRGAWKDGKWVCVPRVRGTQLFFHQIQSLDDCSQEGSFGIKEPRPDSPVWKYYKSETSIVLLPGLAFDMRGQRLGRGGGFYDRFLSIIRSEAKSLGSLPPLCLGLAFAQQYVSTVPCQAHDEKVDGLVTERGLILFSGKNIVKIKKKPI